MKHSSEKPMIKEQYCPEVYWEELLDKDFSITGVGYLGLGKQYNKWLYRARRRIIKYIIYRYKLPVKAGRILDIGCGTGFYVQLWKHYGAKNITGIDITAKSTTELSKIYPEYSFKKADITSLSLFHNTQYDIITAFDVLFHIVDEGGFKQAIRNISAMAKTGAYILITDNFPKSPLPPVFNQCYRTLNQYFDILKANDIQIIEIVPVFWLMNGPVDVAKSNFSFIRKLWEIAMTPVMNSEFIGYFVGAFLYLIDGILIKIFKDSPTTELMICRKK